MICSETTPTARKAAHARPAPSPNRLVKVEAIQSVDSTLVVGLCCSTFVGAGASGSDEEVVRDGDGGGVCGGCEGGVEGGGVCEAEEAK